MYNSLIDSCALKQAHLENEYRDVPELTCDEYCSGFVHRLCDMQTTGYAATDAGSNVRAEYPGNKLGDSDR